jgi:cell division protein FtsI (penicillin-binding protein 3)
MRDDEKNIRRRTTIIGCIFGLAFLIIVVRIIYLQFVNGVYLSAKAADQYESSFHIKGKRGSIFDAKNKELAVSLEEKSICAYPYMITDKKKVASKLSKILKINRKELLNKLLSDKKFVWIKRQVFFNNINKIKELDLQGIGFIPEFRRYYPCKNIAAQALGLSGLNSRGLEGIEFFYDDYLKAGIKEITVKKDGRGKWFEPFEYMEIEGFSGSDVYLTIDQNIQYLAEKHIKAAVDEHAAKSGMVVIMQPATGKILALANYPFFDPNNYKKYDRYFWRNRIVTDSFEPGSVMKMFLVSGAIESKKCKSDTIFFCEDGQYNIDANHFFSDIKERGWLSVAQIVKYSSNIGAVKISEEIGKKTLYNTLKSFGFGEKTGIDFPGEALGILRHFNTWSRFDTGAIAFGQGMSASAIQLAAAASTIANGGLLMNPYIVKKIVAKNGYVVKENSPKTIRRVISSDTAKVMRKILHKVTQEGGTGARAHIEGFSVCGKTGTAQKADPEGGYKEGSYVSSFLGFVPAEQPELTILVSLDEPKKEYYSGVIAAPVFKKIAEESLRYLNISP